MGFIKNAIVGIAIYEAIKYLTKKDVLGVSNFEKLKENAPDWLDKAEEVTDDIQMDKSPSI